MENRVVSILGFGCKCLKTCSLHNEEFHKTGFIILKNIF